MSGSAAYLIFVGLVIVGWRIDVATKNIVAALSSPPASDQSAGEEG